MPDGNTRLVALRTFAPFVRPHWRGLLPAVGAVVATSALGLLKPWPLQVLIDRVLDVGGDGRPDGDATVLVAGVAAAIVAIAAAQGLFDYVRGWFVAATGQRIAATIRRALFDHVQRLSMTYHDRRRTGDTLTRVTTDVEKVQEVVTEDLMVDGVSAGIQLVGMAAIMLLVDWRLGLLALAWAPLVAWTSVVFRRRIRAREHEVRDREGELASLAHETLVSIRVVKAFGGEARASERFAATTGEMVTANIDVARLEARFAWATAVLSSAGLAAVVALGAHRVLAGALSAGTLVVFIQYMRELQGTTTTLARLWARLAKVGVRAERIAEVLREQPGVRERPDARPAPPLRGAVELIDVSFRYGDGPPVLDGVSLAVAPGETCALVGPTGAGKSTVANLVLRLYDPVAGRLLFDGEDARAYTVGSVVDQIAVVLQETLLFRATLAENIAYGRPGATPAEVERAAALALCDEFADRLPQGLDTVVGERGATLSGGQRQRVAIARAIIRDAPILVLDEPTTGLDAESEALVLAALARLTEGRTTIVIAHKLSTVRNADAIQVLDRGRIVQSGRHEHLVEADGPYARALRLA